MRKAGVLLLAAGFLFVTAAPAAAHGAGFHGRVYVWPFLAPLLLPVAVAATVTAGVATVATGVATAVTAPFAPPVAPPAYGPPPAAVYAPAPAYTQHAYAPPPPPAPSYWYYCPSAGGYYPYVRACPGGWLTVLPR